MVADAFGFRVHCARDVGYEPTREFRRLGRLPFNLQSLRRLLFIVRVVAALLLLLGQQAVDGGARVDHGKGVEELGVEPIHQ